MLKVKTDHGKQKHVSLYHKLAQDTASPLPLNCLGSAAGFLRILPSLLISSSFLQKPPTARCPVQLVGTPCLGVSASVAKLVAFGYCEWALQSTCPLWLGKLEKRSLKILLDCKSQWKISAPLTKMLVNIKASWVIITKQLYSRARGKVKALNFSSRSW